MPEPTPIPDTISQAARALLAGLWMNPKNVLSFGREAMPSEEAAAALGELCAAGYLAHDLAPDNGAMEAYTLTEIGRAADRRQAYAFIQAHGDFPLSQPRKEPEGANP